MTNRQANLSRRSFVGLTGLAASASTASALAGCSGSAVATVAAGAQGAEPVSAASSADGADGVFGDTIKVGILHSLSGTMAISETSVRDAEVLAIHPHLADRVKDARPARAPARGRGTRQ